MKYIVAGTLCSLFLMASCVSTNFITVDFKEPAQITFSPDIVNVVVADNSQIVEVSENENKDLADIIYTTDSAQMNLSKYMVKDMDEGKYFGQVIHYPNNRTDKDSTFTSLPPDAISYICSVSNADALIAIDDCHLYGTLKSIADIDDYYELSIGIYVLVKTYKADGTQYTAPCIFTDTLYFSGFPYSPLGDYLPVLPSLQEAFDASVSQAANRLSNLYIPHWQTQQRWYYSDSSLELKKAARHAERYEWTDAALVWGDLYEKEKKAVKKARLASNISLANECLDDVDNALTWNQIAQDWMKEADNKKLEAQIKQLGDALIERKKELGKLREQYGDK